MLPWASSVRLQQEHRGGVVLPGYGLLAAEAVLLYAVLRSRHFHAVVVAQGLGPPGERHSEVEPLLRLLGAGDWLFHVAEEDGACCQHLDVHQPEHLHALYVCGHLGAVARAAPLAVDAVVGLHHAHHLGHHVRRSPGRAAQVGVGRVAVDGAVGAYLVERLGVPADDARLLDVAHHPPVHVAVLDGHHLTAAFGGCRGSHGQGE